MYTYADIGAGGANDVSRIWLVFVGVSLGGKEGYGESLVTTEGLNGWMGII